MDIVVNFFKDIWNQIQIILNTVNNPIFDIIDILIVTFLIYKAIQFMRDTRAEQLIKGILVFLVFYFIASLLNLRAILWVMDLAYKNGIVVAIVLFQPELRGALERMGRGNFSKIGKGIIETQSSEQTTNTIDSVVKACVAMSKDKVGALIVMERSSTLGEIAATGTIIKAEPSADLIDNIFYPKSPLHDGAMIVRKNKIYAAGCILPLTQNDVDSALGTRHRAGIGMSEASDAVVIIVSEETGIISVAIDGKIDRNFDAVTLKERLTKELVGDEEQTNQNKKFKNILKKFGGNKDE